MYSKPKSQVGDAQDSQGQSIRTKMLDDYGFNENHDNFLLNEGDKMTRQDQEAGARKHALADHEQRSAKKNQRFEKTGEEPVHGAAQSAEVGPDH